MLAKDAKVRKEKAEVRKSLPPVVLNGQQRGWVDVPRGAEVQILQVRKQQVMIGVADSQGWVKRADTDFDTRLADFKRIQKTATANVQQARAAENAAFQQEKAKVSADFQRQHANYANPLDRGAYNQTRSVVDYYDWLGRRYHIGPYGERIYQ